MIIQGTGVCFENVGLLIVGPSGAGKTSLAIDLIDKGGILIGDDGVLVDVVDSSAVMSPVLTTKGLIEVRGVGLLSGLPVLERQKIEAVIYLSDTVPERLPTERYMYDVAGVLVPCFYLYHTDFSLTSKVKMIIKLVKRQLFLKGE